MFFSWVISTDHINGTSVDTFLTVRFRIGLFPWSARPYKGTSKCWWKVKLKVKFIWCKEVLKSMQTVSKDFMKKQAHVVVQQVKAVACDAGILYECQYESHCLLLIQLPVRVPGKPVEDGPHAWAHVGSLKDFWALGFGLPWSGPGHCCVWGVNQWIKISLSLCLPLIL